MEAAHGQRSSSVARHDQSLGSLKLEIGAISEIFVGTGNLLLKRIVQFLDLGGVLLSEQFELAFHRCGDLPPELGGSLGDGALDTAVKDIEAKASSKPKHCCEDEAHNSQGPHLGVENPFIVELVLFLDAGDVVLLQGGACGSFLCGICAGLQLFNPFFGLNWGESGGRRSLWWRLS